TRAYSSALDTREQLLSRIARRVLEHIGEQSRQRLAHLRAGPRARRDQVVAGDGEVIQGEGILRGADGRHDLGQTRNGKRETGNGKLSKQRPQVVGVLTHLRQPFPAARSAPPPRRSRARAASRRGPPSGSP